MNQTLSEFEGAIESQRDYEGGTYIRRRAGDGGDDTLMIQRGGMPWDGGPADLVHIRIGHHWIDVDLDTARQIAATLIEVAE